MEWIEVLLGSGVRLATPILLSAIACIPTLWTRDLNIGLEGIMIFGAFFGVAIGLTTGSIWAAVIVTLALAAVCGAIFAFLAAKLKADVYVIGLVLFIFGAAATAYLLNALFGVKGNLANPATPGLLKIVIPGIEDLPVLGAVLSGHSILTWFAVLAVVVLAWLDHRSVIARYLRSAGSHPEALSTAGVNVTAMRFIAQIWCFMFASLAGIQIALSDLSLFTVGMTGGAGFVALAAVIFARGHVWFTALVSIGFGLLTALSFQVDKNIVSYDLMHILPYAAALLALIVVSLYQRRNAKRPAVTP